MGIDEYLKQKNLTQGQFAEQLGVSQGLVWQWITGRQRITAERASQIEQSTGGAVTRSELRPDLYPITHHQSPITGFTEAA